MTNGLTILAEQPGHDFNVGDIVAFNRDGKYQKANFQDYNYVGAVCLVDGDKFRILTSYLPDQNLVYLNNFSHLHYREFFEGETII